MNAKLSAKPEPANSMKNKANGARFLVSAAALMVIIAGLKAAGDLLLPMLVALFLAILSSPLLAWLMSRRVPKPLAVLIAVLTNVAILVAFVLPVGGSVNAFTEALPKYREQLRVRTAAAVSWFDGHGLDTGRLEEIGVDTSTLVDQATNMMVGTAADLIRGVAALFTNSLMVLLLLVFMLFEAASLPRKLERAFGIQDFLGRLSNARQEIQRYLRIKTLMSLLTGVLITTWVWLLGVDFPLLWGLVAFLLNYIPTLGSILASVPAVLIALVELGVGRALLVGLGYLVVNMAIGNFAEPQLMGRKFGLSALVVFLSLLFWGWVWGPLGMLLSVPLTMILKIILENTRDFRWLAELLGSNPKVPQSAVSAPLGKRA
nr:AI-2 transport protein TqsA-like [Nerophis lumbriciformis]